jgi:tetratricopeptide (TPR) repeat protein
MVRDQYARSLRAVGQHAEAAEQFLEAVRLLDGDQENAGPRAYVAALAAEELQRSGRPEIALPAFRRAGDLFEALGDVVGRARCLRSAAWLEFDADDQTPYPERSGVAVMRSVLAFLESASAGESASAAGDAPDLETELDSTRKQLDAMLNAASEDD